MRRFLAPASLAACIWLAASGVATAQDGDAETRPGSTTWFGDTGLWFVPTGEILPSGTWSISGYRANIDRAQGLTDISHFIGTVGVGIGDRVEVFGSVAPGQTVSFVYAVRAVTAGSFTVPPVEAEAMYDPRFWARESGSTALVEGPWAALVVVEE